MNASFKKGLLASVLAITATSALAAGSVDIKVAGKIQPSSCTPSFPSGGGVADFGTIKVSSLNSTSATTLPDIKTVPVAITCEEATRVGVTFTDTRASSSTTTNYNKVFASTGFGSTPEFYFGLGMYNDKKIGVYALGIAMIGATDQDGGVLDPIFSNDSGTTWTGRGQEYLQIKNNNSEIYSFSAHGDASLAPKPSSKINFDVAVSAIINPTNDLNVTDEASLDGLTTVELVYL
ncbi:DUF1120 domain-containing protein [Enterobacter cloacae]|uniref:DUF1120 domain-containing protein n=1 Tax=Enterobacter cloacae complex TaxID=354276 RepID=UPI001EDFDD51|nr:MULTISPECIES: DUF1120 domain-containing protein [Enterobacter cloacae complex]MCG3101474.1 DUF1120 domain-containing protein [Enterobacter sp. DRP3]MCQ4447073.1 DUF1120 domain-containing protein [Enterobacter cloacae]MDW2867894.1 DUF1120 domain-containing protein [Enterobacter hormaechei]